MTVGIGETVTANLDELNKAIYEYSQAFNIELGRLIRYVSVGLIRSIALANPVDTGRSRTAWLPFLWSLGINITVKAASNTDASQKELLEANKEGKARGKFNYKFKNTEKPFAWISNAVPYVVYLEYGVRKGDQKGIELGKSVLSSVSSRSSKGFVRKAINKWRLKFRDAIKNGVPKS